MKMAVIGGGISGLATAHLLCRDMDITLFEANDYLGGHTHTVDVSLNGKSRAVDTGFIVFNERTYPHFTRLLQRLGVASQPSVMSFSVFNERSGLQYCATNPDTLFAQRRNIFNHRFWKMLLEIFRFRLQSRKLNDSMNMELSLGAYLETGRYSQEFVNDFLAPMGGAIWSAAPHRFLKFPAAAFVKFFTNHGILNVVDQPQWRVITGGSRQYVEPLAKPFRHGVRLGAPVERVLRKPDGVDLRLRNGEVHTFDQAVLACHSDQALAMLADPSPAEREVLSAIPYRANDTILHTDSSLLPSLRRARASWNCRIARRHTDGVSLTYWMNRLQSLDEPEDFCVTLNASDVVDPRRIIRRMVYHHPEYSTAAFEAQKRRDEINGVNRTWFCGAYWGYGFHEDGLKSALSICRHFGKEL